MQICKTVTWLINAMSGRDCFFCNMFPAPLSSSILTDWLYIVSCAHDNIKPVSHWYNVHTRVEIVIWTDSLIGTYTHLMQWMPALMISHRQRGPAAHKLPGASQPNQSSPSLSPPRWHTSHPQFPRAWWLVISVQRLLAPSHCLLNMAITEIVRPTSWSRPVLFFLASGV